MLTTMKHQQQPCWRLPLFKRYDDPEKVVYAVGIHMGPLLLTWFNFNPNMDK